MSEHEYEPLPTPTPGLIVPTPLKELPLKELRQLALEGKYVSMPLHLPPHISGQYGWVITLDGENVTQWVREAYAPGMPYCGWVVVYAQPAEGEFFTGITEVRFGNVVITDLGKITHDEESDIMLEKDGADSAGEHATSAFGLPEALGTGL